jgi:hypothetical protein
MKYLDYPLVAITLLLLVIAPTVASAQLPSYYITTLYNTGVDDDGAPLNNGHPNGTVDPHYAIVSGPAALYQGSPYGRYGFTGGLAYTTIPNKLWWNGSPVEWLGPLSSGDGQAKVAAGPYHYQTSFYLKEDCVDLTKQQVILTGQFAADDGACIWVNGVNTGTCTTGGFTIPTFFYFTGPTPTAPFVTGTNRLDFIVNNIGTTPTGLIVEIYGLVSPLEAH